jgi:hypothetical protein
MEGVFSPSKALERKGDPLPPAPKFGIPNLLIIANPNRRGPMCFVHAQSSIQA